LRDNNSLKFKAAARLPGLRVRILTRIWLSLVSVLCVLSEFSAMIKPRPESPTECGESCVIR